MYFNWSGLACCSTLDAHVCLGLTSQHIRKALSLRLHCSCCFAYHLIFSLWCMQWTTRFSYERTDFVVNVCEVWARKVILCIFVRCNAVLEAINYVILVGLRQKSSSAHCVIFPKQVVIPFIQSIFIFTKLTIRCPPMKFAAIWHAPTQLWCDHANLECSCIKYCIKYAN